MTMKDMPFTSGDTLLVEEDKSLTTPILKPQPVNNDLNMLWNAQLGQEIVCDGSDRTSKLFSVEIDVVDTQSGRIDRFGEDMNYLNRIFLLYDGIHYDPLVMEPLDGSASYKTVFSVSDHVVESQALEIAAECKNSRQFTDVANFQLRCITCNKPLKGQKEAQDHATKTGHTNFGEI